MRWFRDGDQVAIVKDDFVDLQVSPAVFVPANSEVGMAIQKIGLAALGTGHLLRLQNSLIKAGRTSEDDA